MFAVAELLMKFGTVHRVLHLLKSLCRFITGCITKLMSFLDRENEMGECF